MTIGMLFWVLMIVSLVLNGWGWAVPAAPGFTRWGGGLLLFVLLLLLGWHAFGTPVHQ
jgi:hypothetical protein